MDARHILIIFSNAFHPPRSERKPSKPETESSDDSILIYKSVHALQIRKYNSHFDLQNLASSPFLKLSGKVSSSNRGGGTSWRREDQFWRLPDAIVNEAAPWNTFEMKNFRLIGFKGIQGAIGKHCKRGVAARIAALESRAGASSK
jgi:hypothetical protein